MSETKSDIMDRIEKFKAECDKKRSAIADDLLAEVDRLKAELRTAAKHYKDFTGKEIKFTLGGSDGAGKADGSYTDAILAFLKDGPKSKKDITTHCVSLGMGEKSVGVAINKLKNDGKIKSPERGQWTLA